MRILDRHVLSSSHTQNGSDGARVLLICPDRRMSTELAAALASEMPGARRATVDHYPSRAEAAKLVEKIEFCLLDVASDVTAATGLLSWLGAVAPGVPVISLLLANDPDLILRCLRGGADDFLIEPFTAEQLRAVLKKLARVRPGPAVATEDGGKVICIMPGKGACGDVPDGARCRKGRLPFGRWTPFCFSRRRRDLCAENHLHFLHLRKKDRGHTPFDC
jgi:CheY-like chemotaxis protein